MKIFNKVVIVGVGLIGGSLGLAIKKRKLASRVIGVFRSKNTFSLAKRKKAVDDGSFDLSVVKGADLVILAGPVKTIISHIKSIAEIVDKNTIIMDVGSTKSSILKTAKKFIKKENIFIGCHPLAGLEKKGVVSADSDLFKNSLCIICSERKIDKNIISFWNKIGSKIVIMDARRHDKVLALTSHIPHLLAFAMVNSVPQNFIKFSGSGFKDTTRIAASDANIWKDIFVDNKKQILNSFQKVNLQIKDLIKALEKGDSSVLVKLIKKAKIKRDSFK
ncbi:MAG: prephenate dehydrogenase [Candidatus Gygaella obscura]|nr:prephenate dehydrogenase [Candidatus Gygaella obscura]